MSYPEHERLSKVSDHSQAIGQFLDWLQGEKGYTIARWWEPETDHLSDGELRPVRRSIQDLLAEYFDIDQDKIEAEKRAMIEEMRKLYRGDEG